MYTFSRRRVALPAHAIEAAAAAIEATAAAQEITGLPMSTWVTWLSPDSGTVVWSATGERLTDLESAFDKLAVDQGFQQLVAAYDRLFVGPVEDSLAKVVYGDPITIPGSIPEYASVVRSTARNGRVREALSAGVQLAQHATEVTHVPMSFLVEVTGAFGGVRWVSGGSSVGEVEHSLAELTDDLGWLELVDSVGPVFGEGTRQDLYRRID